MRTFSAYLNDNNNNFNKNPLQLNQNATIHKHIYPAWPQTKITKKDYSMVCRKLSTNKGQTHSFTNDILISKIISVQLLNLATSLIEITLTAKIQMLPLNMFSFQKLINLLRSSSKVMLISTFILIKYSNSLCYFPLFGNVMCEISTKCNIPVKCNFD